MHRNHSQWAYCRVVSQHEDIVITGDEVFDLAIYCGSEHVPIIGVSDFNSEPCRRMATLNASGESLQ